MSDADAKDRLRAKIREKKRGRTGAVSETSNAESQLIDICGDNAHLLTIVQSALKGGRPKITESAPLDQSADEDEAPPPNQG